MKFPTHVDICTSRVGDGCPAFVIAEIGINHNGDVNLAVKLIDVAVAAGCDAVKFQKRAPELCVPPGQRNVMRETPWGAMTYLAYRQRMEFGIEEFTKIDQHCRAKGIPWFASVWDEASVDFMEAFAPCCYKIPSATLPDAGVLRRVKAAGRPIILSTGMSTMTQIREAVARLVGSSLVLMHCTSTYPCPPEELNLRVLQTLRREFQCPVGYSGHEVGLQTTCAAVVLGAAVIERHITLDRSMWGTDQAASVEPPGLTRLVRDIRVIERALGDGEKTIYDTERSIMKRLRPT